MNHPQDHGGNRSCCVKWRMISSQQIKHPRILSFSPRTFIHSLEDSLGRGWASHPYHEKWSNAAAVFSHQTLADFIPNLAGTTGATGCSTRWFCCLRIIATLKKKDKSAGTTKQLPVADAGAATGGIGRDEHLCNPLKACKRLFFILGDGILFSGQQKGQFDDGYTPED